MTTTNESVQEAKAEGSITDGKAPTVLLSALDNYGGHPFDAVFDLVLPVYDSEDVKEAFDLSPACALIIWGGADISPSIYNQKPNKWCGAGNVVSARDRLELGMAHKAIELGIPIIGICRGAQLMCAMSGGALVQHVDNHAGGYHEIVTFEDETYKCPSLHHQMMWPWAFPGEEDGPEAPEMKMLAWCPKNRSEKHYGPPSNPDDIQSDPVELALPGPEPEIVWFPKTKSLCIQSHPEFINDTKHPFLQYSVRLVREYILSIAEANGRQSGGSKGE